MQLEKTLIPLLLYCLITNNALSQEENNEDFSGHVSRDFYMGISSSIVTYPMASRFGAGLDFEHIVAPNIGFGCLVAGGPNYAEINGSAVGVLALALVENGDAYNDLWIYLFVPLALENPRFHINPINNSEITISLSFLKYRYIWQQSTEEEEESSHYFSGCLSVGYSQFFRERWCINYFFELSTLYTHDRPLGFQFGAAIKHRANVSRN
jgi:hypothetical protein